MNMFVYPLPHKTITTTIVVIIVIPETQLTR